MEAPYKCDTVHDNEYKTLCGKIKAKSRAVLFVYSVALCVLSLYACTINQLGFL